MTNLNTIQVIDSWSLSSGIIVSELKHQFQGLASGLIIKSQTTDKEWKVKTRLIFHHAIEKQKKFLSETTVFVHSSFGSTEKMMDSAKKFLDKEEENIFQYQLQPIGHLLKPMANDILLPVL